MSGRVALGEWQGDAWSEPPGRGRRGRGNLVRGVRPLVPSLLGGEVRQPVPPLFSGGGRQPVPSLLSGGGVRQSIPSLVGNGVRPSIPSLVGGAVRQPVPSLVGRGRTSAPFRLWSVARGVHQFHLCWVALDPLRGRLHHVEVC
jgi:hypothetical protein